MRMKNVLIYLKLLKDWSSREDIKSQLNMDLTILLYENGYPPQWNDEVFEQVLGQAENFKKSTN